MSDDIDSDSNDDRIAPEEGLSAATLALLNAHLASSDAAQSSDMAVAGGDSAGGNISEKFGLSQFWYDDETCATIARAALAAAGEPSDDDEGGGGGGGAGGAGAAAAGDSSSSSSSSSDSSGSMFHSTHARRRGRIALLSAPTAMEGIERLAPSREGVVVFEYDRRFGTRWGEERFAFYDCHAPTALPPATLGSFDFLLADPPYLNPAVLGNFAQSLRLLAREVEPAVGAAAAAAAAAPAGGAGAAAGGGVGGVDGAAAGGAGGGAPSSPSSSAAAAAAAGGEEEAPEPEPGRSGVIKTPCMLITGAVLRENVLAELGFRPLRFKPSFQCKLSNQFLVYANTEFEGFGGFMADDEC